MNTRRQKWHVERHQRFLQTEYGGPSPSSEGANVWFNLIVEEDENDPRLRTPIAEVIVSTEQDRNAMMIAAAPIMRALLADIILANECTDADGMEEAMSSAEELIARIDG